MILFVVSYLYLSYLEFPGHQLYFICAAITISNLGLYSVFCQFKWSCQYIHRRFDFINQLLQQLLFHMPMSDYCHFIDIKTPKKKQNLAVGLPDLHFHHKPGQISYLSHSNFAPSQKGFAKLHINQPALPTKDARKISQAEIETYAKKMNISVLKSIVSEKM